MIGSSKNLTGILNRHQFNLKLGKHQNRLLQEDWRLCGEAGFAFDVLELLEHRDDPNFDCDAELDKALQRWREKFPLGAENSYL